MEFRGGTSLINWLRQTGKCTAVLSDNLAYDNQKTKRLELLRQVVGLPVTRATYFDGSDFRLDNPRVIRTIAERGGYGVKHCFRVAPREDAAGAFNVIKKYGLTFREFDRYFKHSKIPKEKTTIRLTDYRAKVSYAGIVIVGKSGIIGEVVRGTLYHLTYSVPLGRGNKMANFYLPYRGRLAVLTKDKGLIITAKKIVRYLTIKQPRLRNQLRRLGFATYDGYLAGYYEYIEGTDGRGVFTDVNNKKITTNINIGAVINLLTKSTAVTKRGILVHGLPVAPRRQKLVGVAQFINDRNIGKFKSGNILLCERTTAAYLPIMQRAKAIITELGGITSHPAIIARELRIPCLVGAVGATKKIRNGIKVVLDMARGTVEQAR